MDGTLSGQSRIHLTKVPRLGQEVRAVSAPGAGPVVRAGIVGVVQAALGGSEHALRLHHEHVVEVPHEHRQQGQECQAEAEAAEGAADGKGQPVYQPARVRREQTGREVDGLVGVTDASKDSKCLCTVCQA